jgi:solute carrier family 25 2-oxodicarboxylate transporter 21
MQAVAGGTAGGIETAIMHPLDLIKTRFQLSEYNYNGIVDCTKQMYREEGLFSFWKGVLPPLLVQTPKRAYKFLAFTQFRGLVDTLDSDARLLHPAAASGLAGLMTGATEAALVNPTEVVKIKMQADSDRQTTKQAVKEIVREEGVWRDGLVTKGITASMLRDSTWNAFYFGIYHGCKSYLPKREDERLDFLQRFLLGLGAGSVASLVNIPFDVAKSRIQGPTPEDGPPYQGTFRTILRVRKLK